MAKRPLKQTPGELQSAQISEFMSLTGADSRVARALLEAHSWEVNAAVNDFLENPPATCQDTPDDGVPKPMPTKVDQLLMPLPVLRLPKPVVSNPWKNRNLADIFRPPTDMTFRGTFEEARVVAEREHRWILVNIQEMTEFASHQLNRDTWQDSRVRALVSASFLFWQVLAAEDAGRTLLSLYHPPSLPSVAVIDPRTKQEVAQWSGFVDPKRLHLLLTDFLEENDIRSLGPRAKSQRVESTATVEKPVSEMNDEEQLELALRASMVHQDMKEEEPQGDAAAESPKQEAAVRQSKQEPKIEIGEKDEPEPPPSPEATQVQLRLPGGKKVSRRFLLSDTVGKIYSYVGRLVPDIQDFTLVTSYPKAPLKDLSISLQQARLNNSSLIVEC